MTTETRSKKREGGIKMLKERGQWAQGKQKKVE